MRLLLTMPQLQALSLPVLLNRCVLGEKWLFYSQLAAADQVEYAVLNTQLLER
jgi:hypothetical protein